MLSAHTVCADTSDNSSLIKRGEYLAKVGDCIACHTIPDGGKPFAGGRYMDTPFGAISTPNLTPDKTTGIGSWSDDDFYRAMHEGIDKDGQYLYPVFPFPWYTKVTRDDALAIKAYLFSLPPENSPRKPLKFSFPFNQRDALFGWRTLFFRADTFKPDPKRSAQVERGAYIVEGLGHCGECHNKSNLMGASNWSGRLEGGEIEGWYAPNITSDGRQGVGSWSEDEIVTYLKSGYVPSKGVVLGPMKETIMDSLRYLTDDDLHAIAAYLKSTKPEETHSNAEPVVYNSPHAPGAQTYLTYCASCHRVDGKGVAGEIPPLAGNGAVTAGGPQDILRVVLGGLPAQNGLSPMPAVGQGMTDQEIADVADYVRNTWGNVVPTATGAGDAGKARAQTATAMVGNMPEGCPPIPVKEVAKMVEEGEADRFNTMNPNDLIQGIDHVLKKLKQDAPGLSQDNTINSLTDAYCHVAIKDKTLTAAQRATQIGNFAVLVYSQIKDPEYSQNYIPASNK